MLEISLHYHTTREVDLTVSTEKVRLEILEAECRVDAQQLDSAYQRQSKMQRHSAVVKATADCGRQYFNFCTVLAQGLLNEEGQWPIDQECTTYGPAIDHL